MTRPPEQYIAFARMLADLSGDVLRRYFRMPYSVETKKDASPVTIADREAEEAVRKAIMVDFPDHGIFGEEDGQHNEDARWQWVIDPIDGTRSFIAGYPLFTTLIALCYDGVPLVGVIDQPILRERWVGVVDRATTLNDVEIRTRPCPDIRASVMATTSLDYFAGPQFERFSALHDNVRSCLYNGDAYTYAMLASGNMDIVIDCSMKPYDYLALAPVISGAGGVITDWQGKPLTLVSDGSVAAAATAKLHADLMDRLA